jgi:hypothetical protein
MPPEDMPPEEQHTDDGPELRDSPLSPADDERVRRLLAEARHIQPIPPSVATRLDDALAALVADRRARVGVEAAAPPAPRGGDVVDLAARRRRTAANLLVAAAAVVVMGVGISQVLPQGSGGDTVMSQDPAAEDGAAADDSGGGSSQEESEPDSPRPAEAAVKVRSKHFGADVRRLQAQVARGLIEGSAQPPTSSGCLDVDVGPGDFVPVSYDGAPAVVVLRPPSGEVQVVDLYLCGDTEPRRSITLTSR